MALGKSRVMQPGDLRRAVRSLADIFHCPEVVFVGSQALLVVRDDIAKELRMSEEFDAYPSNNREWERCNPNHEASEVINALLGEGSSFHTSFGFFVDGIDERTAVLPIDWRKRSVSKIFEFNEKTVKVTAPEPNDLVASKLVRGDPKDIVFARLCLRDGLAERSKVTERLQSMLDGDKLVYCLRLLANASRGSRTPGAENSWGV